MTAGLLGMALANIITNSFSFDVSITMMHFWIGLGLLAALTAKPCSLPSPQSARALIAGSRRYTAIGETKFSAEWQRDPRCLVNGRIVRKRLQKGWEMEAALTTPTRADKNITAFGETKTLAEWAQDPRCRITRGHLAKRLRQGWDHEKALSTPYQQQTHLLSAFGETKTLTEWSADPRCIVSHDCLRWRMRQGWDPERALTTPSVAQTKI